MQPPQRREPEPQRQPQQPARPANPPTNRPPSNLPPEAARQLTNLSDPRQRQDQYVMAPPSAKPQSIPGKAADAGMAAISHFAIAFGFFGIGFLLSIAISGIIWLYSRRSPYVAYHSGQAGAYQCFVLVFNFVYIILLASLGGFQAFSILQVLFSGQAMNYDWTTGNVIFLILLLLGIVWFFVSILYGVWGGFMVLMGKDFAYPVFGRQGKR